MLGKQGSGSRNISWMNMTLSRELNEVREWVTSLSVPELSRCSWKSCDARVRPREGCYAGPYFKNARNPLEGFEQEHSMIWFMYLNYPDTMRKTQKEGEKTGSQESQEDGGPHGHMGETVSGRGWPWCPCEWVITAPYISEVEPMKFAGVFNTNWGKEEEKRRII